MVDAALEIEFELLFDFLLFVEGHIFVEEACGAQLDLGFDFDSLLVEFDLRQHPSLHLGLACLVAYGLFALLFR